MKSALSGCGWFALLLLRVRRRGPEVDRDARLVSDDPGVVPGFDPSHVARTNLAENRVTSDGRLGVYKTTDAGQSWNLSSKGLPQQAWAAVLRECMSYDDLDPFGVYLGTQSGSVFVSPSEGEEWIEAASQLPPILSIEVAEWE